MRYGIFSDIHSNLEALESVIKAMRAERIDSYICAGDIVGYGADPSSCIKLTMELTQNIICGNHDWASVGLFDISYFNPYAKEAVCWTAKVLNEAEKQHLRELKVVYDDYDFHVVHGSLEEPERFHYILDLYSALQNFYCMRKRLCFIGHSHSPVVFLKTQGDISYTKLSKIKLYKGVSYIVNLGSVGQPRDRDSRACYVIYDTDDNTIEIKRISYDIAKTQSKILRAGLPTMLAERLSWGQ